MNSPDLVYIKIQYLSVIKKTSSIQIHSFQNPDDYAFLAGLTEESLKFLVGFHAQSSSALLLLLSVVDPKAILRIFSHLNWKVSPSDPFEWSPPRSMVWVTVASQK
jgi:hypothetical protein